MTALDLCRLASAAFPNLNFVPIDTGRTISARSPELRILQFTGQDNFAAVVRGRLTDYQGAGPTIEAAHADALACRAEYEPEPAPTVSAPAQLPLF
jgi:hypothetical protein